MIHRIVRTVRIQIPLVVITGLSPIGVLGQEVGGSWVIVSGIQVIQPGDLVVDTTAVAEHVIETGVGHRLGLAEVGIAVGVRNRTILPDDAVGAPYFLDCKQSLLTQYLRLGENTGERTA